jgi:hypothetical protein
MNNESNEMNTDTNSGPGSYSKNKRYKGSNSPRSLNMQPLDDVTMKAKGNRNTNLNRTIDIPNNAAKSLDKK